MANFKKVTKRDGTVLYINLDNVKHFIIREEEDKVTFLDGSSILITEKVEDILE
ncbi:hypothetical protein [Myroides marinus]|uniref:hypothetical protein n=1 Tax=Myroides TaxID=76831 RepID=UPI002576D0A4|nr:hypothetical protein [Myroides marinus]MDM1378173.1 hypothetical protein [Myroides marinus]MDM1385441.1 hypothetical protein [Myroides marinus]MDM1392654.1 hypothetical protein [Myroides marinus]